nr:shikimate O-hydroxycinnamoyltransferase-like [Tanacetum cinerariifolium]
SSEDGLSVVATKLGTPLMLESYTFVMCTKSWGMSSYARAMIELQDDVELKDTIVVNLTNPRQTVRGIQVGPKLLFKPNKHVYQPVSKKKGASASSKNEQARLHRQESNYYPSSRKDLKIKMLDVKLVLVDDDETPLKNVDDPVNSDSVSNVDEVFNETVKRTEVVASKQPWHDHWLPFTNLDLLVPPFEVGSFFCYKKPHDPVDVTTMVDALKTSLSQALVLFYPLAGEIVHNSAGEPEIHCNNKGVDFIEAAADVELRELNFHNPDESIEGKLMPKRLHGVLAIQVTMLKCGGMVIASMFDHRVADGYSANMFISSWANMTRSQPPCLLPSFRRSVLNARRPPHYTRHAEGEQLKKLQLLASENGCRRSKLESFTSLLWKITASFLEDSDKSGYMCNIAVAVDGRRRLCEGDGDEKGNLMSTHFGNVLSIPFKGMRSKV